MTLYCVHVEMWGMNLNTFPRLFTSRLRICNPVLFISQVINAAAHAVQGPAGSTHPLCIPRSWILFVFYVIKYCTWHDDAPPGGALCDNHLDFASR